MPNLIPADRPDWLRTVQAGVARARVTCRGRERSTFLLVIAFVAPWIGVCVLLLAMGGCASSKTASAAPFGKSGEKTPLAAGPETYYSPLARSQVRERAMTILLDASAAELPQMRANAIEALSLAPGRVEPVARLGLLDDNPGVRFTAAMTIGRLKLEASRDLLKPLLRDEDPVVRAAAIYGMTRCGASIDPTPIAQLCYSNDTRQRAQGVFILGEMGNSSAIPMLKSVAADPMPMASISQVRLLRLQVAEALVKLGDETGVETLRASLFPARPEDLEISALAVQIIGEIKDLRSLDQLIYLADAAGEDRLPAEVRLGAAASAAMLGEKGGSFIAEEYWQDKFPAIRAQSAHAFGWIGGSRSLAYLDTMMSGDTNDLVRVAAAAGVLRITAAVGQPSGLSDAGSGGF
ncbi:MAG: HEAT repeat domain-containing protein [Phycisphaeraceae bacterium]|nr:HEAT repeat domain-containing protein [Phycisphaeraceae bacterium]MCB9847362.1 HEAT repeat domain-containing protein [Phycisphaeraceae bacterium]